MALSSHPLSLGKVPVPMWLALTEMQLPSGAASPPFTELWESPKTFSDLLIQLRKLKLAPGAPETGSPWSLQYRATVVTCEQFVIKLMK